MVEVIVVAIFGGLGAVLRSLLGNFKGFIPWGILIANTIATGIATFALVVGPQLSLVLIAGLAGGLSTFSTFVQQTWQLVLIERRRPAALLNVALNIVLPSTAVLLVLLSR